MQTLMNVRVASSMTVLNMLSVSIFVAHTPVVATMDIQICQKTHSFLDESAQVRWCILNYNDVKITFSTRVHYAIFTLM
jgi:hypothetical protein